MFPDCLHLASVSLINPSLSPCAPSLPRQSVNTGVPHRPAFGFLLTLPTSRSVSQSCLWCGLQTSRKLCFTPGSSSRGLDSQFRNCFSWTSPLTGASNHARPNWTPCFSSMPGLPSVCRVHICPSPAARNSRAHTDVFSTNWPPKPTDSIF